MNKIYLLCLTVASLQCVASAAEPSRPSIVLIMTDDMGYGDLGVTGNPVIRTPNLDAMFSRSASMSTFYVSPVCAPTRASLMTGRYNYRTRCIDTWIGRAMMDPEEVTVAELLAASGYRTGIFGKWHLGDCYPMRPMDQGFSESLVHRGGGIGQPSDPPGGEGKYTNPILFRNGEEEAQTGYCTDVYYDNAIAFIERSAREEKPFFVYLPDNCPHGPFDDVPPADLADYQELDLENSAFPQEVGHPLPKKADVDKRSRIFAMVTNVDRNIGRLQAKLQELSLVDNTIVIFMVDNGPNGRRYVAGYNGNKTTVWEGGVRSPFFIQWPARLQAGHTSDIPSAHIDVMPTLLEAAGVDLPPELHVDGRSMLPFLEGKPVRVADRHLVIQAHRGNEPVRYHNCMIRNGRWKLVHPSGFGKESFAGETEWQLFDLTSDSYELKNVAAQNPDVVSTLSKKYDEWFDDVSSTRPDNYAPPRIRVGTKFENPTVLTRQDWRHRSGKPWARDSGGFWLLHATGGRYRLECRFTPSQEAGMATLTVNDDTYSISLEAGVAECCFEAVMLEEGPVTLEVTLEEGDRRRGVHQADLFWLP